MESLHFQFQGQRRPAATAPALVPALLPVLVGVLGSGNLEVLVESRPGSGGCTVDVTTSATGFHAIWAAVLQDFHARHDFADVAIAIHDMGATPAVVSLRLEQAAAQFLSPGGLP